jgi:hypothetical protein
MISKQKWITRGNYMEKINHDAYIISTVEKIEELLENLITGQYNCVIISWKILPLLNEIRELGFEEDEDALYFEYLESETEHLISVESSKKIEIEEIACSEELEARNAAISLLDKIKKKKLTLIDAFSNA